MERTAITRELIRKLASTESDRPLVSIYLPTSARPGELGKNRIRLKNAIAEARSRLESAGADERQADAMLAPVRELAADDALPSHSGDGTAILVDSGNVRIVPLPTRPAELVVAADRYHLKPLFEASAHESAYFVLALSRNDVSLYRGDGMELEAIDLDPDVPRSLADALGHELSEKQLHHHAADAGSDTTIFHGHGSGKDDTDAEIRRFLRDVDAALRKAHLDGSPLILAGVDELTAEYGRLSEYDSILDEPLAGNVEDLGVSDLHEKAWPIFRRDRRRRQALALDNIASGDVDSPVSRGLEEIVTACEDGRVAQLFVASDRERWGTVGNGGREVVTHDEREPGDTDLLDRAAKSGLLTGADVVALPASNLPDGVDAIAVLRY